MNDIRTNTIKAIERNKKTLADMIRKKENLEVLIRQYQQKIENQEYHLSKLPPETEEDNKA